MGTEGRKCGSLDMTILSSSGLTVPRVNAVRTLSYKNTPAQRAGYEQTVIDRGFELGPSNTDLCCA